LSAANDKDNKKNMAHRSNYRRIWTIANGPIPVDAEGRPHDIHHIDGNFTNNSLENLQCVSLQEHYNIHYAQGDYWACQAISIRLNLSENERLALVKLSTNHRKGIPRPDITGDQNPMRRPDVVEKWKSVKQPLSQLQKDAIKVAQQKRLSIKIQCNHCLKKMDAMNHKRWHGDNCKRKPV
jgi:hypothetical protein